MSRNHGLSYRKQVAPETSPVASRAAEINAGPHTAMHARSPRWVMGCRAGPLAGASGSPQEADPWPAAGACGSGQNPTFSAMVAPPVDQLPTDRAVGSCQLPKRLQASEVARVMVPSTYTREVSMEQTRKIPAEA